MANKIKLGLFGMTIPQKVQFIRQIVLMMTGNANYPTPVPTLATMTTRANDMESAFNTQQTAQSAAKTATTALGDMENAADASLNSLANHVEEASGGNTAKIESAGMSTRAPGTPTTSLPAPQNLSVTAGDNEGQLDAQWDPVARSRGYETQVSDDPPTSNSWGPGDQPSGSKTTLTGLGSGTKKWVRVRALGPKQVKSPWSDPAVKRVP